MLLSPPSVSNWIESVKLHYWSYENTCFTLFKSDPYEIIIYPWIWYRPQVCAALQQMQQHLTIAR
jgi:hypothetical protein